MSLPWPQNLGTAVGAQIVPLLRNITQILGSGSNSLQSVGTSELNPPFMVGLYINGILQFWEARAGSDATNLAQGILQAGDYAQTGIIWYKSA